MLKSGPGRVPVEQIAGTAARDPKATGKIRHTFAEVISTEQQEQASRVGAVLRIASLDLDDR